MTEAEKRALELVNAEHERRSGGMNFWKLSELTNDDTFNILTRELERASDIARTIDDILAEDGRKLGLSNSRDLLQQLILPTGPDLVKEAREIVNTHWWDTPDKLALAALKRGMELGGEG